MFRISRVLMSCLFLMLVLNFCGDARSQQPGGGTEAAPGLEVALQSWQIGSWTTTNFRNEAGTGTRTGIVFQLGRFQTKDGGDNENHLKRMKILFGDENDTLTYSTQDFTWIDLQPAPADTSAGWLEMPNPEYLLPTVRSSANIKSESLVPDFHDRSPKKGFDYGAVTGIDHLIEGLRSVNMDELASVIQSRRLHWLLDVSNVASVWTVDKGGYAISRADSSSAVIFTLGGEYRARLFQFGPDGFTLLESTPDRPNPIPQVYKVVLEDTLGGGPDDGQPDTPGYPP